MSMFVSSGPMVHVKYRSQSTGEINGKSVLLFKRQGNELFIWDSAGAGAVQAVSYDQLQRAIETIGPHGDQVALEVAA